MVYLPGIDGTGLAASRQFPFLVDAFDLHCLSIPSADRTPFPQLISLIQCAALMPNCCLVKDIHAVVLKHPEWCMHTGFHVQLLQGNILPRRPCFGCA